MGKYIVIFHEPDIQVSPSIEISGKFSKETYIIFIYVIILSASTSSIDLLLVCISWKKSQQYSL